MVLEIMTIMVLEAGNQLVIVIIILLNVEIDIHRRTYLVFLFFLFFDIIVFMNVGV